MKELSAMNRLLDILTTEQVNDNTRGIDQLSTLEIMNLINEEDQKVALEVKRLTPQIAKAADYVIQAFQNGGRLFYVGAGTSGRIGILDASECPPTFGTPPSMVQGIIAGGFTAIKNPVEGAEDSQELGAREMEENVIGKNDVVIGIAASGRTPYVLGAMKKARELGAVVIGLCNNNDTPMTGLAHLMLEAVVGPEVILGSTRMKAGTSQKLILNMITTTSMVRIGKVYDNLMVDLHLSNEKLIYRAKRITKLATKAEDEEIEKALAESQGHVKTAIVMLLTKSDVQRAKSLLEQSEGYVSKAVELAAAN